MRWVLGLVVAVAVGTQLAASVAVESRADAASSVPTVSGTDLPDLNLPLPDLNLPQAAVTPWKLDAVFELPEIPEPSGLCYCELTGTVFVCDDGGPGRQSGLYEIDLDGNFLRGTQFGVDLEGVTYCGANGLLYVCDEQEETVHIIEPKELKVQGSFQVSRFYRGEEILRAGGNGFEGIASVGSHMRGEFPADKGVLVLLNQDDPTCVILVDLNWVRAESTAEILGYLMLPQRNSGELYWDEPAHELWVVNSWLNTIGVFDSQGEKENGTVWPVKRWEVLPGMAQEGLTFDPQGRMWIGQDVGGVVRYVRGE